MEDISSLINYTIILQYIQKIEKIPKYIFSINLVNFNHVTIQIWARDWHIGQGTLKIALLMLSFKPGHNSIKTKYQNNNIKINHHFV